MKNLDNFDLKLDGYLKQFYSDYTKERGTFTLGIKKRLTCDDPFILKNIEKVLTRYKEKIFTLPRKKSPEILVASGGLDSTNHWALLMKKFKLKVFPIHFLVNKGETKAFKYFAKYFQSRFPDYCADSFYFSSDFFFQFDDKAYQVLTKDPDILIPNLIKMKNNQFRFFMSRHPFRVISHVIKACEYALYLQVEKNIRIRTIFVGFLPESGFDCGRMTKSVLRTLNLLVNIVFGDFSFQITSISLEEQGGLLTGKELVLFSHKHKIPIEKTFSCDLQQETHCGKCISCKERKIKFRLAKVPDKTVYQK